MPDLQRLNPVIFAGFFLLLALENIFDAYRKSNKLAYEFFLAGIYLAIGSLFYSYLLFFIFILWISLAILKPFNWREWVFTILGTALPLYFCFSYFYILYDQPFRLWNDFVAVFLYPSVRVVYSVPFFVFLGLTIVLIALSSQFIAKTYTAKKNLPRKAFTIFLWLFLNSMVVFFLIKNASAGLVYLAAIPISYLFANYFALLKSEFWGNVFLVAMFVLLTAIHVIG